MDVEELRLETLRPKKTNRRPKGPPITCLLCKKIWDKHDKGGRLFMFGGSRPFMAKFEAKMKALVGKDDLESLKMESATKFGRSYICRECYMLVRQAYDGIRKIQRNVAKSIEKLTLMTVMGRGEFVTPNQQDESESGSDQDLDIEYEAPSLSRRALPPVSERIALKIASLKFVTINHRAPTLRLERIDMENCRRGNEDPHLTNLDSCQKYSEKENQEALSDGFEGNRISDLVETKSSLIDSIGLQESSPSEEMPSLPTAKLIHSPQPQEELPHNAPFLDKFESSNAQALVHEWFADTDSASKSKTVANITDANNGLRVKGGNSEFVKEMSNILSNPLLLVKVPQPIQLAEVRNENIYICTQQGCDWVFTSKFFWENHIRHFHYSGKPFQCSFEGCDRCFTGRSKLELHMRSHTDERPFICDICGSGFRGNQELKAHKLTHTSEKAYHCPKCDKSFKLLSSMKRHLQFHDGNLPYHCDYSGCKKVFKSRYDLKCHYRLHTGEKPYKCQEPGCGMAFRIPCQFTMHKRAHTGERPFVCTVEGCNMAYASSNTLQAHLLTHSTDRPYCCEFCGKTLKHRLMYKAHLKKHEGKGEKNSKQKSLVGKKPQFFNTEDLNSDNTVLYKKFHCYDQGCEIEFVTESELQQHNVHSGQKQKFNTDSNCKEGTEKAEDQRKILLCPFNACDKEYENAAGLQDHLTKAHAPAPREKMCQFCGLALPNILELQDHIRISHGGNLGSEPREEASGFVCNSEYCGSRFDCQEDLSCHVNQHLDKPIYQCKFEQCNRTFLLERMHIAHLKEHDKKTPFACGFQQCSESFDSHLKVFKHSKTHFGILKCPIDGCNKSVKTLSSARAHLLAHEKPFTCFFCIKRFASSSQWMKHNKYHTAQILEHKGQQKHKNYHSAENQYICEECGQIFNSLAARKSHRKTHSCGLPYECLVEGCGKAFKERISLEAHQNVHSKRTSLCAKCGKIYKDSATKHRCQIDTNEPEELTQASDVSHVLPTHSSLQLPAQHQTQQIQYPQEHQQVLQKYLPHQLQQNQFFHEQKHYEQVKHPELQHEPFIQQIPHEHGQPYFSASTASIQQNVLVPPAPSSSSSYSSSLPPVAKAHTMNYIMHHFQNVSSLSVQQSQSMTEANNPLPISQTEKLSCHPQHLGSHTLPLHPMQFYNPENSITMLNHVPETHQFSTSVEETEQPM
ncbi:Zinc finger protein 729 [Plakobranchus ocellatus]|uniref:Zinc finger protein 729 n=1 Tax=Plakobranchus ocellatus TaxID=259542 RepID=A0AAV4C8Z5_9GAST|nr:Zinc finger protein 729 [Plakobranchus ocellatus]